MMLYALSRPASAISSEAWHVRSHAERIIGQVESSAALFGSRMSTINALKNLTKTHAETGWDGFEAAPVKQGAIALAVDFIRVLPEDCPMPEIDVDPDGSVSLDWVASRYQMLSISFSGESNRLAYAWLDGTDRGNAVARFDGQAIPPRLMEAIAAASKVVDGAELWAA